MGENLPLFSSSHNGPCRVSESYDDNDDSDDNGGANGVSIPGVRDLPLFPAPVFGVNQANCDDDKVENDKDNGVPIPGVGNLSSFPPSAIGASQADYGNGDDDQDHNGFLIPGEKWLVPLLGVNSNNNHIIIQRRREPVFVLFRNDTSTFPQYSP